MECNEYVQVRLFDELSKRVERLESDVANLRTDTGRNEEQIKMVFKILTEIKDSIKTIADKLDVLEKKPSERWEELIKTIITVAVTVAMTYFITKK